MLKREGIRFTTHYRDDFLVIGPPDSPECGEVVKKMLRLLGRLGLPVAMEKREGPATILGFLGFEIDSVAMTVRLPAEKLEELKARLRVWRGRKGGMRQELDSLVGKLAHASQVVLPGKTFMRRLFELQKGIRRPHHWVRLSRSAQSDIQWWSTFAEGWHHPRGQWSWSLGAGLDRCLRPV